MPLVGLISPYDNKPYTFSDCLDKVPFSEPFVRAHIDGVYPVIEGEYHVTESLDPPAIIKFKRENDYFYTLDQFTDMSLGTAWHERTEKWIPKEERASFRYDMGICTLVGTPDLVRDGAITDYKTMKRYSYVRMCESWDNTTYREQLNLYKACGFPDTKELWLEIIVKNPILGYGRDKYKDNIGPVMRVQVPILDPQKVIDLSRKNIEESMKDNPRPCTLGKDKENWGGIRCKRFCPNRDCWNYGGLEYDPI